MFMLKDLKIPFQDEKYDTKYVIVASTDIYAHMNYIAVAAKGLKVIIVISICSYQYLSCFAVSKLLKLNHLPHSFEHKLLCILGL